MTNVKRKINLASTWIVTGYPAGSYGVDAATHLGPFDDLAEAQRQLVHAQHKNPSSRWHISARGKRP